MIWFECDRCGKRHSRPETSTGSLIFCTCGHGNVVPWESTIPEPKEGVPAFDVPPPLPPRLEPVPVGEERLPLPPRRPSRSASRHDGPKDPAYCFNHTHVPSEQACATCGEKFCAGCLVKFRGETLCGPCKNRQAGRLNRPPGLSAFAVVSLCLGLLFGPAGLCLLPAGGSAELLPLLVMLLLAQLAGLALGAVALVRIEKTARMRGKSLAVSGIVTAAVGLVITAAAAVSGVLS